MNLDELIEQVGGMSRFQFLMTVIILGPKLVMPMGMLMMSFAQVPPEKWQCVQNTRDYSINNLTNGCPADNDTSCTFVYSDDKNTVVNEWNLACDESKILPLITSVQMGGVLFGCFLSGQSADAIGRKKTYFLALLLHAGFNLVAAFSVSWQMFIVFRFCIGAMVGALLVGYYPYYLEFVGSKWRPITAAYPLWQAGTALFALSCWLRPNWSHQHIITAALHIPMLIAVLFAPESVRWLAVKGKLEEAERVVQRMAKMNNREPPANTRAILTKISEEEKQIRESGHKYTYLDIVKSWQMCWKTLLTGFIWMCLSFVYYGISFGVGKLSGSLYLNIFLVGCVELPGTMSTFYWNNKIGRRWTGFSFFAIAAVGAFGVVIASRVMTADGGRGTATTVLALVCRLGVASAWSVYQTFTSETYPTTIRNLGYGAANTAARVGSIVSPFAFSMGGADLLPPFVIVGSLMTVCGLLTLVLKETNNKPLADVTFLEIKTPEVTVNAKYTEMNKY